MAAEPSSVYFPLRSNAPSLIAGAGVASVRRRILLALLLHDKVVLESGLLRVSMGNEGGSSWWLPRYLDDGVRWQRPAQRGKAVGQQFHLAMRPSDAPDDAPFHALVRGEQLVHWQATYEPFRAEIPAALADYVEFGHMNDASEVRTQVGRWDWDASFDETLRRRWDNVFIRDTYVKGTHRDLGNAAILGTALSLDRAHAPVIASRIRAGAATPVLGHHVLELQVPMGFAWSDVVDLKRDPAMIEFAAVMRDVEATALDQAVSLADLQRVIRDEYWQQVVKAEARRPGQWLKAGVTGVGLVAGEMATLLTTGVPLVGGAAGAAAGHVAGEAADRALRPRWLAIHTRLSRARAEERNRG